MAGRLRSSGGRSTQYFDSKTISPAKVSTTPAKVGTPTSTIEQTSKQTGGTLNTPQLKDPLNSIAEAPSTDVPAGTTPETVPRKDQKLQKKSAKAATLAAQVAERAGSRKKTNDNVALRFAMRAMRRMSDKFLNCLEKREGEARAAHQGRAPFRDEDAVEERTLDKKWTWSAMTTIGTEFLNLVNDPTSSIAFMRFMSQGPGPLGCPPLEVRFAIIACHGTMIGDYYAQVLNDLATGKYNAEDRMCKEVVIECAAIFTVLQQEMNPISLRTLINLGRVPLARARGLPMSSFTCARANSMVTKDILSRRNTFPHFQSYAGLAEDLLTGEDLITRNSWVEALDTLERKPRAQGEKTKDTRRESQHAEFKMPTKTSAEGRGGESRKKNNGEPFRCLKCGRTGHAVKDCAYEAHEAFRQHEPYFLIEQIRKKLIAPPDE